MSFIDLELDNDKTTFFFFIYKKNFIENQYDDKFLLYLILFHRILFLNRTTPRWLHAKTYKGKENDIRHGRKLVYNQNFTCLPRVRIWYKIG